MQSASSYGNPFFNAARRSSWNISGTKWSNS
jgi:hypothetical protein